jgi:hypothetical protein
MLRLMTPTPVRDCRTTGEGAAFYVNLPGLTAVPHLDFDANSAIAKFANMIDKSNV